MSGPGKIALVDEWFVTDISGKPFSDPSQNVDLYISGKFYGDPDPKYEDGAKLRTTSPLSQCLGTVFIIASGALSSPTISSKYLQLGYLHILRAKDYNLPEELKEYEALAFSTTDGSKIALLNRRRGHIQAYPTGFFDLKIRFPAP